MLSLSLSLLLWVMDSIVLVWWTDACCVLTLIWRSSYTPKHWDEEKNQYYETTERELLTWPEGEMKNERQSDESDWVQEQNATLETQSREEKATALMDESHIVPAGDVVLKLHECLDTLADEHMSNTPNGLTHRLI